MNTFEGIDLSGWTLTASDTAVTRAFRAAHGIVTVWINSNGVIDLLHETTWSSILIPMPDLPSAFAAANAIAAGRWVE